MIRGQVEFCRDTGSSTHMGYYITYIGHLSLPLSLSMYKQARQLKRAFSSFASSYHSGWADCRNHWVPRQRVCWVHHWLCIIIITDTSTRLASCSSRYVLCVRCFSRFDDTGDSTPSTPAPPPTCQHRLPLPCRRACDTQKPVGLRRGVPMSSYTQTRGQPLPFIPCSGRRRRQDREGEALVRRAYVSSCLLLACPLSMCNLCHLERCVWYYSRRLPQCWPVALLYPMTLDMGSGFSVIEEGMGGWDLPGGGCATEILTGRGGCDYPGRFGSR